ncbi:cytochrome c biogenesis protein [Chryseolinea lacunae]|uniref:Heme exporter protein C n=1 Tax=Chryseolinea lacunae TaxID=2801331 RepID=A0ABS1KMU7_9BACT|nr:cytochrome c biogenesis protein [Chryseolinea lacunae]MBL0740771.1 cytochrome c biogenesis protein CcsA [Chryseolinea lacunae]
MKEYKLEWWKILCIVLLYYSVVGGFLLPVPRLFILNESIRLFYFHFPMWCTMLLLFLLSVIYSVKYLRTGSLPHDDFAVEAAKVGVFFGVLGLATGMVWAKATWGAFWTNDPKLNNTAIGLMIYVAYFVLRGSLQDETQRGRLSAVYNIFAFAILIPLIFILPRMTDSLHPGNGGNPGFRLFDTSHDMKLVIYTAVVAFCLLGWWITTLLLRLKTYSRLQDEMD